MSDPVITRRSEHVGTRQKHTTCQLTEDAKTLKYSGFRFVLIARGQKTHRVGVPVGQEEAFFRAALKDCGWSDEEIQAADMAAVGDTIKGCLFDRRDAPYGANMAFDFRVNAHEVCNEETVGSVPGSVRQSIGASVGSALDAFKARIEAMRGPAATAPRTSALPNPAKSKK